MDVLTLSQHTSSQLALLEGLTAEQVGKMFRVFMQTLLLGEGKDIDEKWKGACDALGTLLIEAVRTRSTEAAVKSLLSEQGLAQSLVDTILSLYAQYAELLAKHLNKMGISLPQLVGVEWRLDYAIRSKHLGKENAPMFFVGLQLKEGGELKDVTFLATLEEMQDLLAKVKDAAKQVERVLHANDS